MDVHRKFTFDDPEDSYWNESSNTTIFDDFRNVSIARQALDDLFVRTDTYGLDDNASVAESEKPKSELEVELTNRLAAVTVSSTPNRRYTTSDAQSVSDHSASGSRKNTISNGLAPEKSFFPHISNASMVSECSVGSFSSDATVHLDYARLRTEHRKLQKHLEKVRQDRFRPLEILDTIKRLRTCQPVTLDFYRSKQQKMELLDAALQCTKRDVIVTVILFLKRTLSNSVFREILILKPEASEYYVSYLRETGDTEELMNTLFAMGRTDEAAMVEFVVASRKRQPEAKIHALRKCLISGLSDPTLSNEAKFVEEYITLLEWQIPIDAKDEELCKTGNSEIFKQYPKKASLIGQPLLTTLYYCCLYHYDLSMNSYASPWYVKTVFNINEKVFNWMAISALSRQKKYAEIEKLLMNKKLLSGYKLVCPFPWSAFFYLIFKYGVPPKEVLTKWLHAIPDLEERLKVCEQFGESPEAHVETLIALRDKTKLANLLKKLNPHSVEYNKAHIALSNTVIN